LGVTILAGRLITRLKEKAEVTDFRDVEITNKDIYTVRLAGLLHDVGHCFLSHASENAIGPIVKPAMKEAGIFAKPHEFFSFLIVSNPYFVKNWEDNIAHLFPTPDSVPNLDDISKIIVGVPPSEGKRFLQDIIYGPYDVDKLEYLYRDARTAGLEVTYDIERYFYKIHIIADEGGCRLAMEQGGVSAVEQMIFSKMMLFSFVYHHQKVLASDILVHDIVMELLDHENERIKIDHPTDFLRYTDYDLFSSFNEGTTERFNRIRDKINNRDLPKRCLVLNKESVINLSSDYQVKRNWRSLLEDLRGLPTRRIAIREQIVNEIKKEPGCDGFSIDDIYFNFPKAPSFDEAVHGPVKTFNGNIAAMSDFFDLEGWKTTYDLKKLKGYFFVTEKYKEVASRVIEKYLEVKYNLRFNENARIQAKIV
jgi:HD superfamily phosphohydrolase